MSRNIVENVLIASGPSVSASGDIAKSCGWGWVVRRRPLSCRFPSPQGAKAPHARCPEKRGKLEKG